MLDTVEPGTVFLYNTVGTYTLSAIITKVTGKTALEYLKPRLFDPLGIEDPEWKTSSEGHSLGGYGLYLRTEEIAKFGQLYLQKGKWNGKQLIPEKWVEAATSKQVPNDQGAHQKVGNDWIQGYGYQFWQCRHGAYRGDGKDGQLCVVIPEKDMVVSVTADSNKHQQELDAIWDHLLPAASDDALPANPGAQTSLKEVLSNLRVHPRE